MWIVLGIFSAVIGAVLAFFFDLDSLDRVLSLCKALASPSTFFHTAFNVEPKSKHHGGEIVAEALKAHGVETIFTLCGGHISPILVASEKLGIRIVDTRHEVTAVFAADAVARLKQTIGVVAVTAGPGLTNTVTAIKNAQMAESPVLLLGGAAATLLKGRGALQDIDQMALFKPLCKFTATVSRVKDIGPTLCAAIHAAQSGTPGPVFVEFPIDTLYPFEIVHRELGVSANAKGLAAKMVNTYLEYHSSRLFGDAWAPRAWIPIPPTIPLPNDSQVKMAAELVRGSEKPLILIGSQAMLPPIQPLKLQAALEGMGIPVFLGGMSRGLMGRQHNLHIRQQRRDALREADLVILAGTVCDFRLGYGRTLSRKSKIISINRSRAQMLKNSDMFWKPALAGQADVGSFLVELGTALTGYGGPPASWLSTLRQRDSEKEAKNAAMGTEQPKEHLNPVGVMGLVESGLPDDVILVADGGDFVGTAAYTLRPRGPLQWLDPGAFGTLGVGGGFALGAAVACPGKPVWIVYGDGSLGYSLAEFDSYTRHRLPVTALVGNDACWSQIVREQVPMFGSSVGCDLAFTEYDKAAEGLGGTGFRVDRDNYDHFPDTLKRAQQLNLQGKSVLLNVLIGKSSFREGSISV